MDDSEPEDTEGETDSPLLPVAGTLYFIGFGTVVMAVGFGIAFGLTQNLEPRWQKYA